MGPFPYAFVLWSFRAENSQKACTCLDTNFIAVLKEYYGKTLLAMLRLDTRYRLEELCQSNRHGICIG